MQLHWLGATVLGIADEPYDLLRPELREALTESNRVDDMHNLLDSVIALSGVYTLRFSVGE